MSERNRWWVVGVFYLSSCVNYLDRQILAFVSPEFIKEFGWNLEQYGQVTAAFSLMYLIGSPLMGWFLDKVGLNVGTTVALTWWSVCGMARGLTTGMAGLVGAHGLMAVGEAAGIPSTAKAAQTYLKQDERAIGSSMSQLGLTLGMMGAAAIANYCMSNWGWRSAFFVAGWLGLMWIPLWWWASKKAPVQEAAPESKGYDAGMILREKQMWGFFVANILSLGIFLFGTTWMNHYLIRTYKMNPQLANQISSWVSVVSLVGSFTGGALSMRLIRSGWKPIAARRRVYLFGALGMALVALVPQVRSIEMSVALFALGYFASSMASVNLYTMPLDAYGGSNAAFAVSLLTSGYGILQFFASPMIGRVADRQGFGPIFVAIALPPLVAYALLEWTKKK